MKSLRERVFGVIRAINAAVERFDADASLSGNGIIDSISMLQIITGLEREFDVEFENDDLRLENFDTIRSIEAILKAKGTAGSDSVGKSGGGMKSEAFAKWGEEYKKAARLGADHSWPSEVLVRIFRGDFVPGMPKDHAGKKVLDVSCGNGSDMVLFGSLGMDLYGTEVTSELCAAAREKLAGYGYRATVQVGENKRLPFADGSFDYLVSWNVLHYEDNEADIRAALAEYSRVLKAGGRLFVCTTGPEHEILEGAETLGGHRYRIGKKDDFRAGQVFFYFDAENYIHYYFQSSFKDVLVGEIRDRMFTRTINFFVVTGVRRD